MSFYLQRIAKALRTRRHWWWLALAAPLLYLIYAAASDLRVELSQQLDYSSRELPIAASNSPTGRFSLGQLIDHPELIFLDEFALMQLDQKLSSLKGLVGSSGQIALPRLIAETMTLGERGDSAILISYQGNDALLGDILVAFYTDRLVRKASEGMLRERTSEPLASHYLRLAGEIQRSEERAWWRADRLPTALLLLVISAIGVLLIISLLELTDPAFKSERQMARYLEMPVLGTMPDVQRLAEQAQPTER
jgi:hypothetical protein